MLDAVPRSARDEAGRTVLSHSEFTARDLSPPTPSLIAARFWFPRDVLESRWPSRMTMRSPSTRLRPVRGGCVRRSTSWCTPSGPTARASGDLLRLGPAASTAPRARSRPSRPNSSMLVTA